MVNSTMASSDFSFGVRLDFVFRLIPIVTVVVGNRPNETSPVSSPTFTTSHAPYAGGFLTAVLSGSSPRPWPSLGMTSSAPTFPFPGQHFDAASFTSCYGLLFCAPFSGGYIASAHPVA